MEQHTFESYGDYVNAQRRVTHKNMKKPEMPCFTSMKVVEAIRDIHNKPIEFGLCHGCRDGQELAMFEGCLGGSWVGTEIVEELCDNLRIFHHDFSDIRNDWIGKFDVIYSNSLDHARDPFRALKAWIACLSEEGSLYVEWTLWHGRLGVKGNKADCFAATDHEYEELLLKAGRIVNKIEIEDTSRRGVKFVRKIFRVK